MLFFSLAFLLPLNAQNIDIYSTDQSVLDKSQLFIDENSLSFYDIQNTNSFKPNSLEHLNLGFTKDKAVWVKFTLQNNTDFSLSRILEVQNPILEEVTLFDENGSSIQKGMLHTEAKQTTIEPAFALTLDANTQASYYLRIVNNTTALKFGIYLKDRNTFVYEDHRQQTLIMLSLGIIISFFIYNLLLYFYSREDSFLYYCLYLATLVWQQMTYLGITPLFFPASFVYFDNLSVLLKVNAMYIIAALFAKKFLSTKKYEKIDSIYNLIILIALIEIPLFGTPWFYYPEVGILTGLVFVLFNIYAGVWIYLRGYKQARFFIIGWSVLAIGFTLMIIDGLGLICVMYKIPNFILYATILEALFLSLAFTDRYVLLKEQKEKADMLLLESLGERQRVIENEIQKQTKSLSDALQSKRTLLKELHHRTKNNLQLILSILRIQIEHAESAAKSQLKDLQHRILAISQTHEMLYLQENLQHIDMDEYIDELCDKIKSSFHDKAMTFSTDARDIHMPLKEAGYIGLVINEIVINSIKHAKTHKLLVKISITKNSNEYTLKIQDNGEKSGLNENKRNTLGMSLIRTLVLDQLEGAMTIQTQEGLSYIIRFRL
ncbi:hypothetical protein KJ877_06105 [bacterium]|nr:hypothetical protein [bacterium]MBU1989758.1 hypothetical protein [bacterium]